MPNQFYSAFPETNDTGPLQKGTVAPDSTGHNSKKTQQGGWEPQSALGRSPDAGRISTTKDNGSRETRVSTNKSMGSGMKTSTNRSSKSGWRCSTTKGGMNYE